MLAREPRVNELARDIDHRAFETIALRQLVAGDLRLARAISRIDVCLHAGPSPEPLAAVATLLRHMANVAAAVLRNALRGLVEAAIELAECLIAQDRELDGEFSSSLRLLVTRAVAGTPQVGAIVDTVFAAKCPERIGDHAKNMAEQVEFFHVGDPPAHARISLDLW